MVFPQIALAIGFFLLPVWRGGVGISFGSAAGGGFIFFIRSSITWGNDPI